MDDDDDDTMLAPLPAPVVVVPAERNGRVLPLVDCMLGTQPWPSEASQSIADTQESFMVNTLLDWMD